LNIPIGTLRDWEQDRNAPDKAAQAYLRVIAKDPDAVRRALGSLSAASAKRPPLTMLPRHNADLCFRRAREFRTMAPRHDVADFMRRIGGLCGAMLGTVRNSVCGRRVAH
jgi:hypothetical protein